MAMNSALKASMRGVPERTIYSVAGVVAVGGAAIALALVAFARVPFGAIVGYALVPFFAVLAARIFVGVLRWRMVGFTPTETEGLIPTRLKPWMRSWLIIRFGLLGSWLLLILAAAVTAIAHGPFGEVIFAFVGVVWFRVFLDLIFGAVLNAGIISCRR